MQRAAQEPHACGSRPRLAWTHRRLCVAGGPRSLCPVACLAPKKGEQGAGKDHSGFTKHKQKKLLQRGHEGAADHGHGSSSGVGSGATSSSSSPVSTSATAVATATKTASATTLVVTERVPPASSLVPLDDSGMAQEGRPAGLGGAASGVKNNIVSTGGLYNPQRRPSREQQWRALVLDNAYRPVNILPWYKAVFMDMQSRGTVLQYYPDPGYAVSGQGKHPIPAVLLVSDFVAKHHLFKSITPSRRNVLIRDNFMCQYCGCRRDLTIDHVLPRKEGGQDTWTNMVTACARCNQKKGHLLLSQLGWRLRNGPPREPTASDLGVMGGISNADLLYGPEEWDFYLAPYREPVLAQRDRVRQQALEAGEQPDTLDW